jgi:HEAT repeat protein
MEKLSGLMQIVLVIAGLSLGGYLLVVCLCPEVERLPAPKIITYGEYKLPPREEGESEVAYVLRCLRSDDDKLVEAICKRLEETIASPGSEFQDVIIELGRILDREPSARTDAAAHVLLNWYFDWEEKYKDKPTRRLNIALYLLSAGDYYEREAAARALGGFRNIPSVDWELSPGPRDYPWREYNPESGQYKDDIIDVRAVLRLLEAAREDDSSDVRSCDIRAWSLLGAAKLDMDAAVKAALKVLEEDESATVRAAAAKVLGDSGEKSVTDALLKALENDKADKVRVQAMHSFVGIDGNKNIDMLISLLDDPAEPMHIYRGYVTCYFGIRYSSGRLVDELDLEESTSVGIEAARGLAEADSELTDKVLRETFESDAHPVTRLVIAHLLHKKGKPLSIESYRRRLRENSSAKVKQYCAWWLGEAQEKSSDVELLIELLCKDKSPEVRNITAEALGKFADTRALPALNEVLESDPNLETRRYAARALGMVGDTSSVKHLIEALKPTRKDTQEGKWLKYEIVWALGRIGERETVSPLLKALNVDGDDYNRGAIIRVLGLLGGEEAIEALKNMLRDDWRLKEWGYAALALAPYGGEEIDNLLREILEKCAEDKVLAALAWRRGGSYLKAATEKIRCDTGFLDLVKAHWGDAKKLGCVCGWVRVENLAFARIIHAQMPEGFPSCDPGASYPVHRSQCEAMEKWYEANKDRLAWDDENKNYYLKEREGKSE